MQQYKDHLETLLGASYMVMRGIKKRVQSDNTEEGYRNVIVFPEGEHHKILRAAQIIREEGIAEPVLLGNIAQIERSIHELGLEDTLKGVKIIRPSDSELREEYAQRLFEKRRRKGITLTLSRALMKRPNFYGAMMVEAGHADGFLSGISDSYPETLRPALQVIGVKPGARLAGVYMMISKKRVFLCADTTVNIDPTSEELADIAIQTAKMAEEVLGTHPRVAMLSFSNFGAHNHPHALKVKRAVEIVKSRVPELVIDGEMQADTAVVPEISKESFPFNQVPGNANILIFPDLQSGNIAYKLIARLGQTEVIGPILLGMNKPVFILQQNSDVNDVVNMAAVTSMEIHLQKKHENNLHA